jgi:hypothetical protein
MSSAWHLRGGWTPAPIDVDTLVAVLEGRHGVWAADVAEFFATLNSLKGDVGRSWAWAHVAERVRHRAHVRQREAAPPA